MYCHEPVSKKTNGGSNRMFEAKTFLVCHIKPIDSDTVANKSKYTIAQGICKAVNNKRHALVL